MRKSVFWLTALVLLNAASVFAQQTPASLETVLNEAQKQSENYREAFKNLLADEVKTFEDFDKRGESDKTTTVKSSFLVYQSGKKTTATAELRNVLAVNGTPVPDSQKRGEEFLAELEKKTTLESELKQLEKESTKYDKTWLIYGLTLNQAVALAPNLRSAFDFRLQGMENFGGSEVYVVSFQQKTKSPAITINEKEKANAGELTVHYDLNVPGELKKTDLLMRGKLWIDAQTFQIRREEREIIARPADPVLLLSSNFEYQPSNFEILVPKRISMTIFSIKKEKSGAFSSLKDSSVNFDYSNYRQTNVEVRVLDEETD